jgi:hypothetical protein
MDQPFVLGNSDSQTRIAVELGKYGSQETDVHMSIGEEDCGSVEEDFGHESGASLEKASLTVKLHEMEKDVAALKRVLAFM